MDPSSSCAPTLPPLGVVTLVALSLLAGCGGSGDSPVTSGPTLTLTAQSSGTGALLQAVSPVDERVVWVSGHQGTFVRTTDGGEVWTAAVMAGEESLQFRDVEAFDAFTAYLMSAGSGDQSRIYRTDDGGGSWRLQYTADHPEAFLDCMAFWSPDRGLAYGDAVDGVPFILVTEDGGESWIRVSSQGLPPALEGEGGFAASGTCVATAPEGRAWVATGAGPRARVLRTEDWGRSWTAVEVPVVGGASSGLFTLRMGSEGGGVALGGTVGGDTLRTENVIITSDWGRSWEAAESPVMLGPVYGSALVEMGGVGRVVAVGPKGMDWSPSLGGSWHRGDTLTYWAVDFASPRMGWAVGPQGRITRLGFQGPAGG